MVIEPGSVEDAVVTIEYFGDQKRLDGKKNKDQIISQLLSIRRWVELTTGQPYQNVAREVASKLNTSH